MSSAANQSEKRSEDCNATGDTNVSHKSTANNQLTYAAAAAKYQDKIAAVYKTATFHKVDKDNKYSFPYEDIPHLLIRKRYSGATLPKNKITPDMSEVVKLPVSNRMVLGSIPRSVKQ